MDKQSCWDAGNSSRESQFQFHVLKWAPKQQNMGDQQQLWRKTAASASNQPTALHEKGKK